jgi:succinoglycan biosynthesis protein ExoA
MPAPPTGSDRRPTLDQAGVSVTLAIPCLNEAAHIRSCLETVLAQDYGAGLLEIIVADGGSTDGTPAILRSVASAHPEVRVIANPGRIQAAGMNEILRVARGDVIVRMDVHCSYSSNYVSECVGVLERTGADCVGGAQRARPTTPFQEALCAALTSWLAVGGARYRSDMAEGFVDTVFLGAYRRRVFETVGLYDPAAATNEDAELNQRLLAAGGRIYLSRSIEVHYYPRESFRALANQYFRYGQGRARTLLKHKRLWTLRPALPFLALLCFMALLAVRTLRPIALWGAATYVAACGIEALRASGAASFRQWATILLVFPTLHLAHAAGFAVGLLRYLARPDWGRVDRLEPRTPVRHREAT